MASLREYSQQLRVHTLAYRMMVEDGLKDLQDLQARCKHQKVVVLYSAYGGSYSWDYDDQHDELRKCLVCGKEEDGNEKDNKPFKHLLNPIARFELGGSKYYQRLKAETPFDDVLLHPLSKLVKFAKEKGYRP